MQHVNHERVSTLVGYILSDSAELSEELASISPRDKIFWHVEKNPEKAIEFLLTSPPNIAIIDMCHFGRKALDIIKLLRGENVYRTITLVLCLTEDDLAEYNFNWSEVEVDEIIVMPSSEARLRARVEMVLARASRTFDTNPLTFLPGNSSIIKFVQSAIANGTDFALAYADLDNFKAFNDKYGFARGDEILMLTGRLISSTVLKDKNPVNFVGHVGGDDFVFCMSSGQIEEACKNIISTFDDLVPSFYDEEDRTAGKIISTDRQGEFCTFALMGISIAVVLNTGKCIKHYGQAAAVAAQLKKCAKLQAGSVYVMDRRKCAV